MGVNLWSVIHGIQIFVPIMLKQDNECYIINTSSLSGLLIAPFQSAYNVTKHGIISLSETLSYELMEIRSKIRVSVLCPAGVFSNIHTSERNRPIELKNHEPEIDFDSQKKLILGVHPKFESKINQIGEVFASSFISPEDAGEIVFEAIKNNIFYILTDTNLFWKSMIKGRMNRIFHAFKKS